MKRKITALLLLSGLLFFSCKKTSVKPAINNTQTSTTPVTSTSGNGETSTGSNAGGPSVTGLIRLKLSKDATNTDAIIINFKPTAKPIYVIGEDAPTLQGYGAVNRVKCG